MRTELVIPEPTLSLNQLRKLHKNDYKRLRDKYHMIYLSQSHAIYTGPVKLTLTRMSTGELDYDNLVGGAKPAIDALVNAGILPGDKPKHIPVRDYKQLKLKRTEKGHEQTMIVIEPVDHL